MRPGVGGRVVGGITSGRPATAFSPVTFTVGAATEHLQCQSSILQNEILRVGRKAYSATVCGTLRKITPEIVDLPSQLNVQMTLSKSPQV